MVDHFNIRHLTAIDMALAVGLEVPLTMPDGKTETVEIKPLTYYDMAKQLQWRKKQQLEVYLANGGAQDPKQRFCDIHDITLRDGRSDDYHVAKDPGTLLHLTWLALRHAQPAITLEEVDAIISDANNREMIVTAMQVISHGPIEEADSTADPSQAGTPAGAPE